MNVYGYLRVSTEDQDHGVDAQRASIERSGTVVTDWFEEKASGKDMTGRPVFQEVLERVCDEGAMLVVAKLDRLGRSVIDVLQIFEKVHDCGASIKVVDMGIDTSTPAGKLMLTVLAGFAEFERAMIGQRTKEGLAAARAKGVRLGSPRRIDHDQIRDVLGAGGNPKIVAANFGCSLRTVQRIRSEMASAAR